MATDIRSVMEYDVVYDGLSPAPCTYCGQLASTVVKEHHESSALGHLIMRCPEHGGEPSRIRVG